MNSINKNIAYLSIVQILRFVIPLVTFPYLTRILGVTGFGYIGYAAAIISYGIILSQYGFNLTSTSRIAQIKNNRWKLDCYCSAIYYSRLILLALSFIPLGTFLYFISDSKLTKLIVCMLPMLLGDVLIPTWLYQGLEKMKALTLMTLAGRAVSIPLIFIFVKNQNDIYIAAFFNGLPFFITGIISVIYVFKNKIFHIRTVKLRYVKNTIILGWNVFITTVASNMYLSFITVIVGVVSGAEAVGYFNIAQNIRNICLQCFTPIYQSTYPRISDLIIKNISEAGLIARRYLKFCFVLALLGTSFVYLFCNEIIMILAGESYVNSEVAVKISLIAVVASVLNNYFGVQTLIPTNNSQHLKNVVLKSAMLCLLLSYPIIKLWSYEGAALLLCISEIYLLSGLYIKHKKLKLNIIVQ